LAFDLNGKSESNSNSQTFPDEEVGLRAFLTTNASPVIPADSAARLAQARGRRLGMLLTHAYRLPTLKSMDVHLSPDQKAFARHAIEAGRIQHEEDAVHQALAPSTSTK
jgi:hypothetical protein